MFDDIRGQQVDTVFKLLMKHGKGEIIPWPEIESAMGCHRDDRGGRGIIKRVVKRLLREREIVAFPQMNVGLRLLTDLQAATEVPVLRQDKARRQINKALRETDAVNVGVIPQHHAVALAMARRNMRAERLAISRSKREVAALLSPTPRNPCRPSN